MSRQKLQIKHLDKKISQFQSLTEVNIPSGGWLKAIRESIGMTLRQLGEKLSVSKQSIHRIEKREKEGSVSLNTLKRVANEMDLELVYGFVPRDGSLEKLIERRAYKVAQDIVNRSSTTMNLEDQQVSDTYIKEAVKERATKLENELPKILWD